LDRRGDEKLADVAEVSRRLNRPLTKKEAAASKKAYGDWLLHAAYSCKAYRFVGGGVMALAQRGRPRSSS
jgi:hypothetical protein